jgi:site-specific recombinase
MMKTESEEMEFLRQLLDSTPARAMLAVSSDDELIKLMEAAQALLNDRREQYIQRDRAAVQAEKNEVLEKIKTLTKQLDEATIPIKKRILGTELDRMQAHYRNLQWKLDYGIVAQYHNMTRIGGASG